MSLESGKLRHRIAIETPLYTQDQADGAMEPTWNNFVTVWAAFEPLSARDFVAAKAEQSKIVARFQIRALPGLNHTMRIIHADKIYSIEGILPDKESGQEYFTIPVSEGVRET